MARNAAQRTDALAGTEHQGGQLRQLLKYNYGAGACS